MQVAGRGTLCVPDVESPGRKGGVAEFLGGGTSDGER